MKTEEAALMVPQRAVSELQGLYRVAVVDADNTVRIRSVKVGGRYEAFWIIGRRASARRAGVVVEGVQKVREGVTVNPIPYSAKP